VSCCTSWRRARSPATSTSPPICACGGIATSAPCARNAGSWRSSRDGDDFAIAQPWLERILALKRTQAAALAPDRPAYDAHLDEYEPGARGDALAEFFVELQRDLLPVARAQLERAAAHPRPRPNLAIAADRQLAWCRALAPALGFDLRGGRLDTSAHPFTVWIGPGDVRLTTRIDPADLTTAAFATLHEAGHGMYDQGLDAALAGRAAGEPASASLHEAQARLWENVVGRGLGFWRFALPHARPHLGLLPHLTPELLFAAVNEVRPGARRAEADELTYDLHIALRFRLERALLSGDLSPADLPSAWNDAARDLLGVTPPSNRDGCLQDGHWFAGMFGYFPTYSLGNAAAAQLFAAAELEIGRQDDAIARGDFAGLRQWLWQHVYRHGHRHTSGELVRRASGAELTARALVQRLTEKAAALSAPG
jgi:carboxypeptidase Taq